MVFFIVNDTEYEFEDTLSILEIKKELLQKLNLSCKYIDLEFCLERPMRILGKFNVEPGKVPRTFDRYKVNEFAFKDKVSIKYIEIDDYDPDKPKIPLFSGGRGRGRGRGRMNELSQPPMNSLERAISSFNHNETVQEMNVEPTFNLSSNDDFPTLGN